MINLRPHQAEAIDKALPILKRYGLVYLSMQMRTGKTITALTLADQVKPLQVLFVTKKKAIPSIENDFDLVKPGYDMEVINYASLHKVQYAPDLVIVDEAHNLGAFPKPSQRAKRLRKIAFRSPVIYLSGTPSPESFSQLYHQFWISERSPWFKYVNFYQWARHYVNVYEMPRAGYNVKIYKKAKENLVMQGCRHLFVSKTQAEAGFKTEVDERFIMWRAPKSIKHIYQDIEDKGVFMRNEDTIASVKTAPDMINKLSQVAGGTLIFDYDKDGTVLTRRKADFIRNEFHDKKIAIIYKYRAEFELLKDTFPNWTDSPEQFNEAEDRTFLGQFQSVREGVSLKSADSMVMYNIGFSATSYWQIRDRMMTREREDPAPLYWVFSNLGIEELVYKAVKGKQNFTYTYYKRTK